MKKEVCRSSAVLRPREPGVNDKAVACGLVQIRTLRCTSVHAVALALAAGGCPVQQLNRGDLLLIAVLWLLSRSRVQTVQAATACEEGRYVALFFDRCGLR